MKPYSSYPRKSELNPNPITNEDLLSNFQNRIEGIEKRIDSLRGIFKETIKESIEGCSKICLMKIGHTDEKTSNATIRIDTMGDAIQEIKQILREAEGSRKTLNWIIGIEIAIVTLILVYMGIKG